MTSNKSWENDIDFAAIYIKANEILVTSEVIMEFPYKIGKLIKEQTDIRLCSYSKALRKYDIDIRTFGSQSAVLEEMGGAHIIFYNDEEPDYRVRFSIGHEYGHYVLNHKMNLSETDPLYGKQEIEANCFAAQILMPEQVSREFMRRGKMISVDFIMNAFGVSEEAAQKRKKTLANFEYEWRKRAEKEYDDIILSRFMPFIDIKVPKKIAFYDNEYEISRQAERDSWFDK